MATESDPIELFERWYAAPLRLLQTLPNGDGAFVALAVALSLYERFAKAFIKELGKKADGDNFFQKLASDFALSIEEAETFWEVMRHGFQHQAMPMQGSHGKNPKPKWLVNGDLPRPIQYRTIGSERVLMVQPWLFRDTVLSMYEARPNLISYSQSFPWASIFPVEFKA